MPIGVKSVSLFASSCPVWQKVASEREQKLSICIFTAVLAVVRLVPKLQKNEKKRNLAS